MQKRLNGLALMYNRRDILVYLDVDEIINELALNSRREDCVL